MPFSLSRPRKDLVKKIKKRHPKATKNEIKQFIHVFNSVLDKTNSEARAYSQAWGVLNKNDKLKSSHRKTDPKETKKSVKKWEKKNKIKVKSSYLDDLVALANYLDSIGRFDDADEVSKLIK